MSSVTTVGKKRGREDYEILKVGIELPAAKDISKKFYK